ncbi:MULTISPECIES: hypothetical protein [Streptomyces]|uniref:SAM-dependent methyltransferase n=1 Tax=Streptomyces evansiae TaxID=3075535 RepID=A0ABD5EAF4_9ACTN|nr:MULTISPECIES: hypothetical protein [unclassified Streptomyces]MDT0417628.1 hypothetical protein [Streptomyces sp. DSM 41982]
MSTIPQQSVSRFHDELAADYHLIHWDGLERRSGALGAAPSPAP